MNFQRIAAATGGLLGAVLFDVERPYRVSKYDRDRSSQAVGHVCRLPGLLPEPKYRKLSARRLYRSYPSAIDVDDP